MTGKIHYVIGDATDPQGPGPKILAHVCNDYGGWGRGFVVALSNKDRRPERVYRRLAGRGGISLGTVHFSMFGRLDENLLVANMVAQHGNSTPENPVALDYQALATCLSVLGQHIALIDSAVYQKPTVHMPRIGCGLGGGSWDEVERIVFANLCVAYGLDVFVYDLPTPEAIEVHHLMDEEDKEFQKALIENAKKCSMCGQPLPDEESE